MPFRSPVAVSNSRLDYPDAQNPTTARHGRTVLLRPSRAVSEAKAQSQSQRQCRGRRLPGHAGLPAESTPEKAGGLIPA